MSWVQSVSYIDFANVTPLYRKIILHNINLKRWLLHVWENINPYPAPTLQLTFFFSTHTKDSESDKRCKIGPFFWSDVVLRYDGGWTYFDMGIYRNLDI